MVDFRDIMNIEWKNSLSEKYSNNIIEIENSAILELFDDGYEFNGNNYDDIIVATHFLTESLEKDGIFIVGKCDRFIFSYAEELEWIDIEVGDEK